MTPATAQQSGWLSTDDVARMLGINEATVGRLVAHGGLPAYRFGRVFRYRADEVAAWVERQRVVAS